MSEAKATTVRLSKAAKECNISVQRAAEYLSEKGVEIDVRPNTKLEGNAYELLIEKFQPDLLIKLKSKEAHVERVEKESVAIDYIVEKAEDKKAEQKKAEEAKEEAKAKAEEKAAEAIEAKLEKPKAEEKPVEVKDEPKAEEPKLEEKVVDVVEQKAEKPKVEEKVVDTKPEEKKPETKVEAPKAEEKAEPVKEGGLKVVGKINLEELKKKPIPKKKYEKPKPQPKSKPEAPKKVELPKPVVKEEKKIEPRKEDFLATKVEKLQGVKLLGKIELPVERKPGKSKPVASSDDPSGNKKRKRKRIGVEQPVGKRPPQRSGSGSGPIRGKREPKPELTEADIQKEIKDTLARLSGGGKNKGAKLRRAKRDEHAQRVEDQLAEQEATKHILEVTEFVSVGEIAIMMDVSPTEVISACMSLGIFAAINQRLDAETLQIIAEEFGFELKFVSAEESKNVIEEEEDKPEDLVARAPIVTVMGHVDHGKTSLLDYVRKANVIAGEAGGITQHIGAYKVQLDSGKNITFLDTPGHEAFTAMRARGAKVTDIAIIVIAADDNVMPQTKEAINHAQAAGVPMVFAINKIDKDGANPERVKEDLAQMNILVEDWGGKYQCQEISAKKGLNIEELLEKVLLEAEILELKANPTKRGIGTVIEATLDKGRGFVTTLLVEAGVLKVGDVLLAGTQYGRVKAMFNERGNKIQQAGPSDPVTILGLNGAVSAGDRFNVMAEERDAKEIANKRQQLMREQGLRTQKHITLDEIGRRLALGDFQELNLILKGDVDGSIEALSDSLLKLSTENIQINIIHKAVGPITDSDVLLASASDAIILGFQVRPIATARKLAEREEIDIRSYSIIYQALDEVKAAMEGMLSPEIQEKIIGTVEVRETFDITKVGTIAGCFVTSGKILRGNKIRLIRGGIVVHTGELGSLKRFKDDVKEIGKGYECGLNLDKHNDIKIGDIIESYEEKEVARKL